MAAPHPSSSRDLVEAKREARGRALAARTGCEPAWGARLTEHVLRDNPPPAGAVVSGFWPLVEEIDIRPLLLALLERGHEIVLPVTPPRGQPLGFRLWRPGDPMAPEKFGTVRPTGVERTPDFLLVPLLAFDRRGRRLGYGAGYYDRTLTALPAAGRLGCAYAAQEMDEVPAGPHDVRLPAVATERGIIRCVIEG
jgi:5-formyltetrahydrofolate cyclo-ligase